MNFNVKIRTFKLMRPHKIMQSCSISSRLSQTPTTYSRSHFCSSSAAHLHRTRAIRQTLRSAVTASLRRGSRDASPSKTSSVSRILIPQFFAGATLGPLLDGIHGTVHLLTYKVAPVDIGGLHSSLSVPLLLGTFYAVIGPLHLVSDDLAAGREAATSQQPLMRWIGVLKQPLKASGNGNATRAVEAKISVPFVALNTGCIAALLYLSAVLYDSGTPYPVIFAALSACALANYALFDRTRQGFVLALLCAIAAPLSELILINVLKFWEYPHPDIFGSGGVPSWVACCYFFYTTGVGNLARLFSK